MYTITNVSVSQKRTELSRLIDDTGKVVTAYLIRIGSRNLTWK
jgi:hypothetical protein